MKSTVSIARKLRWAGFILFVASFLTPQIDSGELGLTVSAKDCGLSTFLMATVFLAGLFGEISGIGDLLCALLVVVAWLNNFSVFLKLPPAIAWIPILIPWAPLIAAAFDWIHLGSVWTYVPFYPWAIGIGLIHASAYIEPKEVFNRWTSEF